jgi:hypothetical protein
MAQIITRSQKDRKNVYITMVDSSMQDSLDQELSPIDVVKNKTEELEKERDGVRHKLRECQAEVKLKCKEITLLKRQIQKLQKYEICLKKIKNNNRDMKLIISEKDKTIENMKREMERNTEEWEMKLKEYQENSRNISSKLTDANRALRANYDDIYEKLQVYKDYIGNRGHPIERTDRINITKNFHFKKPKSTQEPTVYIVGDEYAKGLGFKMLNNDSNYKISIECRPDDKLMNYKDIVTRTMQRCNKHDALAVIAANGQILRDLRALKETIEELIKVSLQKKIALYIASLKYGDNVKKNQQIYDFNLELYRMTNRFKSVNIIETNERIPISEQILFRLKFKRNEKSSDQGIQEAEGIGEQAVENLNIPVIQTSLNLLRNDSSFLWRRERGRNRTLVELV